MNLETVLYSVDNGIARIVMNRADKRNALNHQLLDDIEHAFAAAEDDDAVGVIVLSANGPSFCAGYDLKGSYYTSVPRKEGKWTVGNSLKTLRGIEARYQRIWNCPKPTIAQCTATRSLAVATCSCSATSRSRRTTPCSAIQR